MRAIGRYRRGMSSESGFILITAIFVMLILALIGFAMIVVGANEISVAKRTNLNDDAYAIAEAGINRACVYVKDNPTIAMDAPASANNYWVDLGAPSSSGYTPQWSQANVKFPDPTSLNTYSVEIWQSGRTGETSVPNIKVIRATGTAANASRADMTATRTIEARIAFATVDSDYDACLDYTIFNGNNQTGAGVVPPAWPPSATVWAGGVTVDGKTPCPLTGREPRGAIYTRGPIDMAVHLSGNYTIKGNMISTDYINLTNTFNAAGTMKFDGHVIAGIDPSVPSNTNMGNIYLKNNWTVAASDIVTGYLAGTGKVDIEAIANAGGKVVQLGGILSGKRVSCRGTGNLSDQIRLGRIHASGGAGGADIAENDGIFRSTVDIRQTAGAASYTSINCGHLTRAINGGGIGFLQSIYDLLGGSGNYTFDHVGVGLFNAAGGISGGDIFTDGKFLTFTPAGGVSVGTIYTNGTDSIGVGVDPVTTIGSFTCTGSNSVGETRGICIVGDLSFGTINAGSNGSGKGVALLIAGGALSTGTIKAVGNVDINWIAGGGSAGEVRSNNDVNIGTYVGGSTCHGLWAGHDVNTSVAAGAITTGKVSGTSYGARAVHDINRYLYAGVLVIGNTTGWVWNNWTDSDASAQYGGSYNLPVPIGLTYCHDAGNSNSSPGSPNCATPTATAYPNSADVEPFLPQTSSVNPHTVGLGKLNATPPVVDARLLLDLAGLNNPAKIIEPNWDWYKQQAQQADSQQGVTGRHLVWDGCTADRDGSGNGTITIQWDNSAPYSSNEIVYALNGEDIIINALDWSGRGADYAGTLITKGNINIAYNGGANWSFPTGSILNMAAGNDIWVGTSGFSISSSDNSSFHFWAGRNIDLRDVSNWSFVHNKAYTGSWTAGNSVFYNDHALITNTTFSFSRWVVPSEAWMPQFKVLNWREL